MREESRIKEINDFGRQWRGVPDCLVPQPPLFSGKVDAEEREDTKEELQERERRDA